MLLLKNPQFLRNHYENWWKCLPHEYHIFTNFRNDCVKIEDFLIKAYFWVILKFGATYCKYNIIHLYIKIILYGPVWLCVSVCECAILHWNRISIADTKLSKIHNLSAALITNSYTYFVCSLQKIFHSVVLCQWLLSLA